MTIVAYFLTIIIVLAEIYNYRSLNNTVTQHMSVDKSLGKKMRVDLNMTFPAIHCDDVHIDIMDIAGDAHNDVEDTMKTTVKASGKADADSRSDDKVQAVNDAIGSSQDPVHEALMVDEASLILPGLYDAEDDHAQLSLVSVVSVIGCFIGEEEACHIEILKK